MRNKWSRGQAALFWSWNLIFLVFVNLGVLPLLGADLLRGLSDGRVNLDFVAFFAVLGVVPPASAVLGWRYLRHDSRKLFEFLYCIELPLLVLTLFRIFAIRDMSSGTAFFLALFGGASIYRGYRLLAGKGRTGRFDLAGATMYLVCGAWVFMLLAFLVPPMGVAAVKLTKIIMMSLTHLTLAQIFATMVSGVFLIIGSLFLIYTATLFVLFPLVYMWLAWTSYRDSFTSAKEKGARGAAAISAAVILALAGAAYLTGKQNHRAVLAKFEDFGGRDAEKIEFQKHESHYRAELTDIFLAPYRYLGEEGRSDFIRELYRDTLDLSYEHTGSIQNFFNMVAWPFIYHGSPQGAAHDQAAAEKYYREFFDGSIQEDEREKVRHAIQATFSRESIEAGLINIDERRVRLERQEVNLREDGEFADLEIHEVYASTTGSQEEVMMSFRLPEGAVITGVWLSDDETKKYAAGLAPRGAAQRVYRTIVKQGEDPALVEQIGPDLYRARVFPVPGQSKYDGYKPVMHFWLKVRMVKANDADWKLPVLTEKRQLFWNSSTEFLVNGSARRSGEDAPWLPASLPVEKKSRPLTLVERFENFQVEMEPRPPLPPVNCSVAVVVDTSQSMAAHKARILEVKRVLEQVCKKGVDYYLWSNKLEGANQGFEARLKRQVFWGVLEAGDLAKQLDRLTLARRSVLVVTDRTIFREDEKRANFDSLQQPTWFLMIDGTYPRSLSDELMSQLYKTGGGLSATVEEFLSQMRREDFKHANAGVLKVSERYVWRKATVGAPKLSSPREPLLTHLVVVGAMQGNGLKALDQLQKLAVRGRVVTPYSSMIVLINDRQKHMLSVSAESADRFKRETETGAELLSKPGAPFEATAVPEPEEWALIILVIGFVLLHIQRKGFKLSAIGGTMRF